MNHLKVKVVGIGGAGNNVVSYLKKEMPSEAKSIAIDTDFQCLMGVGIEDKIFIGQNVTRGLSSGGDPTKAQKAVEAVQESIESALEGSDIIFVVCGLGGGTGSGVTPLVVEWAKKLASLVVVFGITPFSIEGGKRLQVAHNALVQIRQRAQATITVPNDLLLQNLPSSASVLEAFNLANYWISRGIFSLLDMLYMPGIINIDFEALKRIFCSSLPSNTLFGLGKAQGENAVEKVLQDLAVCPLLHMPHAPQVAGSLIVNITGGVSLSLKDVNSIANHLREHFKCKDELIMGAVINDSLKDFIEIVVIGVASSGGRGAEEKKAGSRSHTFPQQQVLFSEFAEVAHEKKGRKEKGLQEPCMENRGYFLETEKSIFKSEDLDVPTYLRKGIKIHL